MARARITSSDDGKRCPLLWGSCSAMLQNGEIRCLRLGKLLRRRDASGV